MGGSNAACGAEEAMAVARCMHACLMRLRGVAPCSRAPDPAGDQHEERARGGGDGAVRERARGAGRLQPQTAPGPLPLLAPAAPCRGGQPLSSCLPVPTPHPLTHLACVKPAACQGLGGARLHGARAHATTLLGPCRCPQVDILIVNCSLFNPTPSLSAMLVNHFKMKSNIVSYNLSGMGCSAGVIAISLAKELLQVRAPGGRKWQSAAAQLHASKMGAATPERLLLLFFVGTPVCKHSKQLHHRWLLPAVNILHCSRTSLSRGPAVCMHAAIHMRADRVLLQESGCACMCRSTDDGCAPASARRCTPTAARWWSARRTLRRTGTLATTAPCSSPTASSVSAAPRCCSATAALTAAGPSEQPAPCMHRVPNLARL